MTDKPPDREAPTETVPRLSGNEVRRRASAGLFYITSSGAVLLVIGFVGNLVLARLLTPHDFGVIALGATVINLATTLADGGLAAALIRREDTPSRAELGSLTALQLMITSTIAVVAIAVALQFGEAGRIASVMIVSLPLSAFQIGGRVILIRELAFARTSFTDVVSMGAFYTWSITTAALGAGAWSMATGTVLRAGVSTAVLVSLSPVGWLWPSVRNIRTLMPTVRFGIRFQLAWITHTLREQVINAGTAAISGVTVLGEWSLASRLMQLPTLIFDSVWRVSYPAMAHLLAEREDPKPILEKAARIAAVAAVLVLAPFAAAMPELVPRLFGEHWSDAGAVVPLASLGLLLVGPISVSATGYLNAANRPGEVLRATLLATAVMIPVSFALLPSIGILALGIGWIVEGSISAMALARYVRRSCGARLISRVAAPTVIGAVAGAAGWLAGSAGPASIAWSIAAAGVALGVGLGGLALTCPRDVVSTFGVVRGSVRSVLVR